MTWQDQLQQLDAALAAGKISADDYRRQRDELLSSAQSSIPQAPQAGPNSDPFPAAFKWSAQPPSPQQPQQPTSEATQFIRPATPPGEAADRTQVVPNAGNQAADRTQVVPNTGGQPIAPQQGGWPPQAPPQQGGWPQQGGPDSGYSPPWGGDQDFQSSQWSGFSAQGPEVFDDSAKSGKGKVIAIAAVVVVLLVAAGLYFFVFKQSSSDPVATNTSSTSATPTTTTKKKPEPFGTLIVPEGTSEGPKTYDAEQLANTKPLPTPDLLVLKQAGTTEARSVIAVEDGITTSMWAFKVADPEALQDALLTDQKRFGFVEDPAAEQDGVAVYTSTQQTADNKSIIVFRSHYITDDEVIRVEVFAGDEAAAKDRFGVVLAEQLDHQAPKK